MEFSDDEKARDESESEKALIEKVRQRLGTDFTKENITAITVAVREADTVCRVFGAAIYLEYNMLHRDYMAKGSQKFRSRYDRTPRKDLFERELNKGSVQGYADSLRIAKAIFDIIIGERDVHTPPLLQD